MNIAEIEQKAQQVSTYHWLEGIAETYRKAICRIDAEKEFFVVTGIKFECRNDGEVLNINPHRTIPYQAIREGLAIALASIKTEMAELKEKIEK